MGQISRPLIFLLTLLSAATPFAQVVERAPAFAVRDTQGKLVTLTDFDERVLVLEWTHPQCDAVQSLYEEHDLPALQQSVKETGVIWLTVFSSARGKEGFLDSDQVAAAQRDHGDAVTAALVDDTGIMARMYRVSQVPHLVVIDIAGRVAWQASGRIDPAALSQAISQIVANREPAPAESNDNGCELVF